MQLLEFVQCEFFAIADYLIKKRVSLTHIRYGEKIRRAARRVNLVFMNGVGPASMGNQPLMRLKKDGNSGQGLAGQTQFMAEIALLTIFSSASSLVSNWAGTIKPCVLIP